MVFVLLLCSCRCAQKLYYYYNTAALYVLDALGSLGGRLFLFIKLLGAREPTRYTHCSLLCMIPGTMYSSDEYVEHVDVYLVGWFKLADSRTGLLLFLLMLLMCRRALAPHRVLEARVKTIYFCFRWTE